MSLSFNSLFGEQDISINCPVCKKIIELKLNQVDSEVECPNCKNKFKVKFKEGFSASKAAVDDALKGFEKALGGFDEK